MQEYDVIEVGDQNELVPTSKYPYAKFGFEFFNPVQSRLFEFYSESCNIIVASTTGSGKTICAEMVLAYEMRHNHGKTMYLSPQKSLTRQKIDEWVKNHHFSDLKLSICTGDYRLTPDRRQELIDSNLILMTSEMLNSRGRNFRSENNTWIKDVKTIVVDESHLLGVSGRGDHLEAGIMKLTEVNPDCRLVFLSATMPNLDEIAEWLSHLTKRRTYIIKSTYRPIPLITHYIPYDDSPWKYQAKEQEKINSALDIVRRHPNDKFLLFAHSKDMGRSLVKALKKIKIDAEFHNGDLPNAKRIKIENDFADKNGSRVLVATSTLAWGCYKHGSLLQGEDARPVEVEHVKPGDKLLCPVGNKFENRKVIRIKDFDAPSAWNVQLETGEEMTVSEDHLFWSAADRNSPNWNQVTELQKGDFIATPADLGLWKEIPQHNEFWYLTGASFGGGFTLGKLEQLSGEISDRLKLISSGNYGVPPNLFGHATRSASFLRGWFDIKADFKNNSIVLVWHNKRAIWEVRALLLCWGIHSSILKSGENYCLKITGTSNLERFQKYVGFRCDKKTRKLDDYLKSTPVEDYVEQPYYWAKISKINPCEGGKFREIEVEEPHAYVGCGAISHNCNLPARRVIVMGIHRGLSPVPVYDITQEIGRSGRPGYDPRGDAYVLIPNKNREKSIEYLTTPQPILSQILDESGNYKVLAFHLVSEIHHGDIKTIDDIHKWYHRSLAYFQNRHLHDTIVDDMISALKNRGIIQEDEQGELTVTSIGKIASMFYYSPFDVADLKRNFNVLFKEGKERDDVWIAFALANIESHRMGIVSNADREVMGAFKDLITHSLTMKLGNGTLTDSVKKMAFCYYGMLNGCPSIAMSGIIKGLQADFMRLAEVIHVMESMLKWEQKQYIRDMTKRVSSGVDWEVIELCRIPGIAKVKARKLWDASLTSLERVAAKPNLVKLALKCSDAKAAEISAVAAKLLKDSK